MAIYILYMAWDPVVINRLHLNGIALASSQTKDSIVDTMIQMLNGGMNNDNAKSQKVGLGVHMSHLRKVYTHIFV